MGSAPLALSERRIDRVVARHQALLDRCLLYCAILAPTIAVVALRLGFGLRRPDTDPWLMIGYVAPLLFAGPIWVRYRLRSLPNVATLVIVIDAVVFVLASARFVVGEAIPFSGHTLFLTYSAATTPVPAYRWLALALFVGTTVVKLLVWQDPYSWGLGIALGLASAAVSSLAQRRHSSRSSV